MPEGHASRLEEGAKKIGYRPDNHPQSGHHVTSKGTELHAELPLKKMHPGWGAGRDCSVIEFVWLLGPIPSLQDPWRILHGPSPKPPRGVVRNCQDKQRVPTSASARVAIEQQGQG
jgi:hypothetical protein